MGDPLGAFLGTRAVRVRYSGKPEVRVTVVLFLLVFCAVVGWLVAAVSGVCLVFLYPHPDISLFRYMFRGMLMFDADNFAPAGAWLHRLMLAGMAAFCVFSCSAGVLGALLGSSPP